MADMDELRQEITDICFENGGVTKPMVDKLEKLFANKVVEAQTLHLSDISRAVGILDGLGHPDKYLDNQRNALRERIKEIKGDG